MVLSNKLISLSALVLLQAATVVHGEDTIVGGSEVPTDTEPWVVSLQTDSDFSFCGSSLIGPSTILTAAHCVANGETNFKVVAGTTDLDSGNGVTRTPTKVYVHEDYDADNILNDIAIIQLASPITNIDPITWGAQAASPGQGTILGWGRLGGGQSGARKMRQVDIPLPRNDDCRASSDTFEKYMKDSMICIGYEDGSKGSCNGDSGGPLTEVQNGQAVQIGLTSWGLKGCISYGVYTRLSSYKNWIDNKLSIIEGNGPVDPEPKPDNKCSCVGSDPKLTEGKTCGTWLNQTFNWCYSSKSCEGSTASQRYEGYHWFKCDGTSRFDQFSYFESLNEGAVLEASDVPEDFSSVTGVTGSGNVSATGDLMYGGIGAGLVGLAAVGGFFVYKKSTDAQVAEAIERVERERSSMALQQPSMTV